MKRRKAANDNHKTSVTYDEAIEVWLMSWAGHYQHAIAAHFGVNSGRVSEVLKEKKHIGSRAAAEKLRKKSA